jgi:hypothetical protein
MPNAVSQDNNFYYIDGKRIAKNGLSESGRNRYDAMVPVAQPTQSMTPKPAAGYDPRFDAPGAQIEQVNSLEQLGINPNAVSSAAMAPALNISNPAPVQGAMPVQAPALPPMQQMQPVQPMVARQSVQTDVQQGFKAPAGMEQATIDNAKQRIEAAKQIGIAEQKATQEVLKENQKTEFELAQQDYMRQQIDERKKIAVNDAMGKYQATIEELDNAKVDPDKFYGGSMGKRVLAAIAIGLGEFSRIWTGGNTNNALNIINKAIDDDIGAQRANITQLGNKANLQRQMMSDLRAKYDDETAGNLAVRAAMLDQAQRKISQIGLGLKSEQAKANAVDLMAKIDQEKNNSLLQLAQLTGDKVATRTMTEFATPSRDDKAANEAVMNIRKERNALATTKETQARNTAMNNLRISASKNTGPADITFITSYMKMLDPGSVVREGEFKLAEGAGGKAQAMLNMANKVLKGGRLTPEVKADFLAVAEETMAQQLVEQDLADVPFRLQAKQMGLAPELIFEPKETPQKPANELSSTFQPRGK